MEAVEPVLDVLADVLRGAGRNRADRGGAAERPAKS
jgi:hypothetical protein